MGQREIRNSRTISRLAQEGEGVWTPSLFISGQATDAIWITRPGDSAAVTQNVSYRFTPFSGHLYNR